MDLIQKRFDDLEEQAQVIAASRETTEEREARAPSRMRSSRLITAIIPGHTDVDFVLLTKWRTPVNEFLQRVFGDSSKTTQSFATGTLTRYDNAGLFDQLYAIFQSAKEQYEGGYLFDVERLVHASVFEDELEQAENFLSEGYKTAAAVTAGVVLETTLRRLCNENGISTKDAKGKSKTIDPLNTELVKANVYVKTRQKEITAWAGIRNDAAHGHSDNFDEKQVKAMIEGIRGFISSEFS